MAFRRLSSLEDSKSSEDDGPFQPKLHQSKSDSGLEMKEDTNKRKLPLALPSSATLGGQRLASRMVNEMISGAEYHTEIFDDAAPTASSLMEELALYATTMEAVDRDSKRRKAVTPDTLFTSFRGMSINTASNTDEAPSEITPTVQNLSTSTSDSMFDYPSYWTAADDEMKDDQPSWEEATVSLAQTFLPPDSSMLVGEPCSQSDGATLQHSAYAFDVGQGGLLSTDSSSYTTTMTGKRQRA